MLLAVACSATPTPTPPPPPTPTLDLGPRAEGTLRVAVVGEAPHRDLHQIVSEWATLFGPGLAYSRLLRFTDGAGPSLRVECDLCEAWRQVDERTLEFDVHPRALWQGGLGFASRPVTAQDVVFSLERLRTPGFPHAALLDAVDAIQVVSDRTVRLLLRYPDADLPRRLASPYAVIMAPEALGADVRTAPPVGSGSWRFEQGASGQVSLDAWVGSHRGEPSAKRIEMIPVPDFKTGAVLLKVDLVDIAQVGPAEWDDLSERGFESVVVQRQGVGSVLALNARAAPLDEVGVRRAIFAALDPWAALDEAFDGLGSVGAGVPVVEPSWLLDQTALRGYFADPGVARAGLDGVPALTLTIANFGERHLALGEALARQLREAGLDVTVSVLSRSEYFRQVWQERDFQLLVGPLPPAATTNDFLLGLVHSQGQQSVTGHADAELDALIEAQSAELDPAARGALVRLIQERILDQALLFMPVITAERWVFGARVQDFVPAMPMGAGDFWRHAGVAAAP